MEKIDFAQFTESSQVERCNSTYTMKFINRNGQTPFDLKSKSYSEMEFHVEMNSENCNLHFKSQYISEDTPLLMLGLMILAGVLNCFSAILSSCIVMRPGELSFLKENSFFSVMFVSVANLSLFGMSMIFGFKIS